MALCTRCGRETEGAAEFCSGCASYPGADGIGQSRAVPAATAAGDYLRPFAADNPASAPLPGDTRDVDRAARRDALTAPAQSPEWPFPSPSGHLPDFPPLSRTPAEPRDSYGPGSDPQAPAVPAGDLGPDIYRPDTYRPAAYGQDAYRPDANRPAAYGQDAYRPDIDRPAPRGPFTPAVADYSGGEPSSPAPASYSPGGPDRPDAYPRASGLPPAGYPAGDSYPANGGSSGPPGPTGRLQWAAIPGQRDGPPVASGEGDYDSGLDQAFYAGQATPGQTYQATPGQTYQATPGQTYQAAPAQAPAAPAAPVPAPDQAGMMSPPAWPAQDQLPGARPAPDAVASLSSPETGILREPGWREPTWRGAGPDAPAAAAPGLSQRPPRLTAPGTRTQAKGQRNGRWISIAAAAVVLVICAATAAVLLSHHKAAPKGSPRAASTRSPKPATGPVVTGLITVQPAAAGVSSAPSVVSFLNSYFTAINHHDFAAYRRLFSTSLRGGLSADAFASGYGTSTDSLVTLHTISPVGTSELDAAVTFTSRQQPADSPTHTSCTAWVISLYLIRQGQDYVIVSPPAGYQASFSDCS
jgi:hypothetical protein